MSPDDKSLLVLHGEIRTPPMSRAARLETGFLLRRLQKGEQLAMPDSRPMPSIGSRCHELRVRDQNANWRLIYRIDEDAVIILAVFAKKTGQTPKHIINICRQRIQHYDASYK